MLIIEMEGINLFQMLLYVGNLLKKICPGCLLWGIIILNLRFILRLCNSNIGIER